MQYLRIQLDDFVDLEKLCSKILKIWNIKIEYFFEKIGVDRAENGLNVAHVFDKILAHASAASSNSQLHKQPPLLFVLHFAVPSWQPAQRNRM